MPRKNGPQISRTPRKELQLLYDLADQMSYASHLMEHDDEGNRLGRDPKIVKALEKVREAFQLEKRE